MGSVVLSCRVSADLYDALLAYSQEQRITPAVMQVMALKQLVVEQPELPEDLKVAVNKEVADRVFKEKMRKLLFVHNVQRKINKLAQIEKMPKENIPKIIVPLLKGYIELAELQKMEEQVKELRVVLGQFESKDIREQIKFMKWAGFEL